MPLTSPRADELRIVRSMCHFLQARPDKTATVTAVSSWLVDSAKSLYAGKEWRKSRVYHYRSAFQDLGLGQKVDRHNFALTDEGRELVAARQELERVDAPLNDMERRLLGRALFKCKAVRTYLAFFMPDATPPGTEGEFAECGRPVRIARLNREQFSLATACGSTRTLDRTEKNTYVWTLHKWLRTVGLVDDVFAEERASFLLRGHEERVLYPLKCDGVSVQSVRELLLEEASNRVHALPALYIPELLVTVAVVHGIPKAAFLNTLVRLYEEDPLEFHLEMTTSLRTYLHRRRQLDSYENYPVVDGVPRSHVRISCGERKEGTYHNE